MKVDVKKSLLDKISKKVAKKEALKQEIADRSKNVETFILRMLEELDDSFASTVDTSLLDGIAPLYELSIQSRLNTIDPGATVKVEWRDTDVGPRSSGILVTWSEEYQRENNCEAQLYIDVFSAMFR